MAEKLVPTLAATADLTDDEQRRLELPRVKYFRALKLLDNEKLAEAFHAESLDRLKDFLAENDQKNAEAYRACTSADDAYSIAPWYHAQLVALTRGRFVRVEEVRPSRCDVQFYWGDDAFGDGHVRLSFNPEDGKIHADTEGMGRQMLRSFLLRLADDIVIDG